MSAAAKPTVIAQTKWHHMYEETRVRKCIRCGSDYPSTSSADRICPDCNRSLAAARVRAAAADEDGIKELTDDLFDWAALGARALARDFDNAKRAARQHAIMVRKGLGGTPEARLLKEKAELARGVYKSFGVGYEDAESGGGGEGSTH